jgi:hypothetical protein
MSASPAIATRVVPTAEPLWNIYPLNPTGQHLVSTEEHPFVPPIAAAVEASDRDGRVIVSRARLLVLLCAALIAPIVLCLLFRLSRLFLRGSRWSNANGDVSGGRLLAFSIIGSMVAAEVLYGYVVYTVLVLLL